MSTARFDVSLISSGHNVADARLHRLVGALVRSGLSVEVIALGSTTDAPAGAAFHRAVGGKSIWWRVIRSLALPWQVQGKVILAIAPELIPMSIFAARMRKHPIAVDVYEDYLPLLRDRAWAKGLTGALARVIAMIATGLAKRADLTVVADVQVPPLRAINRLVVRNLPDLDLPSTDEIDKEPRAIYIGDVRRSRGLATMLATIEATYHAGVPWRLDVVGPVAPADQLFVDEWQAHSPAAHLVTFCGRQTLANSWERALGAWVGLSFLEPTPAFMAAIPSKLYEYAAAHLAVLTTPLPRAEKLVVEHALGKVVADSEEAAAALISWASDVAELRTVRAAAAKWAKTLDSSAEYGRFAEQVATLGARRQGR
jgi:glycosyltransferase involved in cell wall biosynthesis